MYPFFDINGYLIYTFGLTLVLCFFLFFWMLKKLSVKYSFDVSFFIDNILYYFLSVFFFSRLFYIFSQWQDSKYIDNPIHFFVMSDYHFSLYGALFGFFLILLIDLKFRKEKLDKYIDGLVLSFLFILFFGYLGALLGGQVYGADTDYGIEIIYTHSFTPIPDQATRFPLPIVYSIMFFLIFSVLYILSMFIKIRGFIGYMGLLLFATTLIIFENFTGRYDMFKNLIGINMNQFISLGLMLFSFYKLYLVSKIASKDMTVLMDKK